MTFLFLHGWQGSEPEHWQRWLARELAGRGHAVRFPDFTDPDVPVLEVWLRELQDELALVEPSHTTVLAHSLGCHLWLHHAATATAPVDRVLLVAPPSPALQIPELESILLRAVDDEMAPRAARVTELVFGEDDPYFPGGAGSFGAAAGVVTHALRGGGHINVAAGFGPWPAALAWCERTGSAFSDL